MKNIYNASWPRKTRSDTKNNAMNFRNSYNPIRHQTENIRDVEPDTFPTENQRFNRKEKHIIKRLVHTVNLTDY